MLKRSVIIVDKETRASSAAYLNQLEKVAVEIDPQKSLLVRMHIAQAHTRPRSTYKVCVICMHGCTCTVHTDSIPRAHTFL